MLSIFRKKRKPEEADRTNLVPRIKTTQMLTTLQQMGVAPEQCPITEPLVADLLISYAFDLPERFEMMTPSHLERLAIRRDELRALAISNLKRQLPQIGMMEEPPVHRIVTGNDLEACVLLADTFWEEVAAETPGEVIASVPSRNVLLFCSSLSEEGLLAMQTFTAEVYASETTHALSNQLFVWRGGCWAPFSAG